MIKEKYRVQLKRTVQFLGTDPILLVNNRISVRAKRKNRRILKQKGQRDRPVV